MATILAPFAMSERRVTTRKKLTVSSISDINSQEHWLYPDSAGAQISFCGYEKKAGAKKETLFLENLTDSAFSLIHFTINYFDTSNRQIHSRQVQQTIDLPRRSTRRIDFRSWDTQNTYYYLHGPAPRASATPYTVTVHLDSILLSTPNP